MRRLFKAILLSFVAIILVSMPVLAAVSYRAPYTIIESSGNAYDMLPVLESVDNQWLADNGFMEADALDTRIQTLGGSIKPHMVATNKTLTSVPVPADSHTNLYYTTANTDLSSMDIIEGYGGYITIDDDATLELGSDFEIEQSGYVDTSDPGMYSNLVHKRSSAGNSITDTEEITGIVYFDEPEELVPSAYNAWTDVDVSAYVPAYATGIVVHLTNTTVGALQLGVRINGSADALVLDTQNSHGWTIVGIDANDIFEVYLEDATCHCYLVGFTGSDFTFKTAADDISLGVALAWTDIDLSTEAPNATGAIIVILNNDAANLRGFGVRMDNSGDARINDAWMDGISWAVVGCDGSQVIEGYVETLDVDFYLVGYTTGNVTFNLNAVDKSLGAFTAWTDIDCSANTTPNTTHLIFEMISANVGAGADDYGFRRNGSAENITLEGYKHFWAIIECDEAQIVEGYAENANVDFFLIGYIEGYIQSPYERSAIATSISSDEYTVKTYGVANEPAWATGDVLHFDGTANSSITAGAIYNAAAKLWISLWFRLDDAFSAASATDQYLFGKTLGGNDYLRFKLAEANGKIRAELKTGGVVRFDVYSTEASWNADQWYHVIVSISDVAGMRMIVDGGAPVTDADLNAAPNGGNFVIGLNFVGGSAGIIGEIQNVVVGTDDLLVAEEAALYAGTAPGDETNYWYIDEATGLTTYDYGTGGNDGTIGAAPSWETTTYTTGSTGRLCDFYIEVDDGVADPDRWGVNLKGASVPDNANDWILNQNNVMPYMDYYYHTTGGVLHAWYQPNDMVEATDSGGTETAGGSAVLITAAEITEAVDYWVGGLVTITDAGGAAPEGESRVCTASAVGTITVGVAFSANVDIGDTFTVDFATLVDRSYYGIDFDGTNDYVDCGADASLNVGTGDFTIECWVRTTDDTTQYQYLVSKRLVNDYYVLRLTFGVPTLYLDTSVATVTVTGTTNIATTGDWYYIVGVVNRTTDIAEIFVNNISENTGSVATLGNFDNGGVFTIARYQGVNYWLDGSIDEVRLYKRVLSSTDMDYNYNAGAGRYTPYSSTSLAGEWHMEEGSGNTTVDTSGNGNTGTLTLGPVWINGYVPRPAGDSGTNDSRITWGANPTGVAVTMGSMVSTGQPVPGVGVEEPSRDVLPEAEVSDWYIDPDVSGSLLTNPLRPFVTILSDNTILTEILAWRLLASAAILLVTVATAMAVGKHQGITAIMAGASILGVVVLTIFPMWALVVAIGLFIGGLVMERSPSL